VGGTPLVRKKLFYNRAFRVDNAKTCEGPPLPCLSRTAYRRCDDCRDEACCEVRIAFAKAYDDYLVTLESLSLAAVMRQSDSAGLATSAAHAALSGSD
jgi:hypothetical protein